MKEKTTKKTTSATYCSGFDCTVCPTCFAHQPTSMKPPRMTSQLKLSIDWASGSASPVLFLSSRRRHTRFDCDWSSDVCSSDLVADDDGPSLVGIVVGQSRGGVLGLFFAAEAL